MSLIEKNIFQFSDYGTGQSGWK